MKNITQEELKEALWLDQASGVFYHKRTKRGRGRGNYKLGDKAGRITKNGYEFISVNCQGYFTHRLIFLYNNGAFPEFDIDHINHIRSDNRPENIREVTRKENLRNQSLRKCNSSGFIGVTFNKNIQKWVSYITIDGKYKHLGRFLDKDKAILARMKAEHEYEIEDMYHENHGAPRL